MKKNSVKKIIMVLVAFAIAGFGTNAFAGSGCCNKGLNPNSGQGQRGAYGGCPAYAGELGEDKIQELDQERNAFYEATEALRQSIDEKEIELRNELAKEASDVERLSELQKDVSDLRVQLDQKRLEHIVRMKEINPNISRGWYGGHGYCGHGYGGYGHGGRGNYRGYGGHGYDSGRLR